MTGINAVDFMDELRFDIREKDRIKAGLVLSKLDEVDEKTRKMALFEINRSDDAFAIPLLVDVIAAHRDLDRQYPTLREILYAKALYHPEMLLSLLEQESRPKNRIVLVEVVGEMNLEAASAQLLTILNEEEDPAVIKAVVITLGVIGDTAATTAVSEYLYSGDLELILAAIQALGQLSTPTAFQRLSEKLGTDPDIDALILDVFAVNQSPFALERLNECLSSHHANIRNTAKTRLKNMGGKPVPGLIANLLHDDSDLLIHTLNLLGEIGDETAVGPIRKLLHNEPKDANVRFAAYEALGLLPVGSGGAFVLAQGLSDPVENVRAVAASAIDRNYTPVLAAGLKNMVRSGPEEARDIASVILNAGCATLFLNLLEDEPFQNAAIDLLCGKVHPDITERFVTLMRENGYEALTERIGQDAAASPDAGIKVFAVDDSKMILRIYQSALHELGCTSRLFDRPADALKALADGDLPHVMFTDLNMPEMSGIDVIREARRTFDKNTLPIFMVTTQNEVQDNDAAIEAGVNAILHKPFTAADLEKAMKGIHLL